MPQISASLPRDVIKKVTNLSKKKNWSFSATVEYLVCKGLDKKPSAVKVVEQ